MLVPVLLGLLAFVDAALAGFRAATGRNARIRKRGYYLRAGLRGLVVGVLGIGLVALVILVTLAASAEPGRRYEALVRAGVRLLTVLVPFAAVVVVSLVAYWLLPMRESTFVILVGLGPFTLVRPVIVLAGTVWSVVGSTDWLVWFTAITAAAVVLSVEPVVHRRWYSQPV